MTPIDPGCFCRWEKIGVVAAEVEVALIMTAKGRGHRGVGSHELWISGLESAVDLIEAPLTRRAAQCDESTAVVTPKAIALVFCGEHECVGVRQKGLHSGEMVNLTLSVTQSEELVVGTDDKTHACSKSGSSQIGETDFVNLPPMTIV